MRASLLNGCARSPATTACLSRVHPIESVHNLPEPTLELISGDTIVQAPRSRLAILAWGTRGDFQPYVALYLQLRSGGHHVRMYAYKTHTMQARQFGVEMYPLDYDIEDEMNTCPVLRDAMLDGDMVKIAKAMEVFPWPRFTTMVDDIAAFQPDLLLGGMLSRMFSVGVAEALGIPSMWVDLQPVTPTSQQPSMMADQLGVGAACCGAFNASSHAVQLAIVHSAWEKPSNPERIFRSEALGLPADERWTWSASRALMGVPAPPFPMLVCVSPTLVPRPTDWPAEVKIVGPLLIKHDEILCRRPPPPELERFLDAGPPPIYIGWGSMICKSAEHMTEIAVRALREAGERGIVLSGWAQLSPDRLDASRPDYEAVRAYARERIFFGNDLPHEWLFPRCKCLVHHGGSGTVHAALRSGQPMIITPVFTDQFSYQRLAVALGVCVPAKRLHRLNSHRLAAAIRKASLPTITAKVKTVSNAVRDEEDGARAVVEAVEAHLREKVWTGAWKADFEKHFLSKLERPMGAPASVQATPISKASMSCEA